MAIDMNSNKNAENNDNKERKHSFWNKFLLLRLVFGTVCIIGCIFQIVRISQIYFSYETNTDVKYEFDKMVSLPGITICFKKDFVLKRDVIIKMFPKESNQNSTAQELFLLLNRLSVRQQLEATLSAEHIFHDKCVAMKTIGFDQNRDYMGCHEITPIKTTLGFYWKCFRFFSQTSEVSDDKYLINHDVSIRDNWKPIIAFNMTLEYSAFAMFMHPRNEILRDFFGDNKLTVYFEDKGLNLIKYSKTKIKLLPSPYITKCVDFTKLGYQSKMGCIKECVKKYYMDEYQGLPAAFQFTGEYDGYFLKDWKNIENNLSHNSIVTEKCTKHCGDNDDCFKEYFKMNFISIDTFFPRKETVHQVLILPPTSPNLIYTHSQKIHFEEYLCFAASVISLWFGVSILQVSDLTSELHDKVKEVISKENISKITAQDIENQVRNRLNRLLHKNVDEQEINNYSVTERRTSCRL